MALLDKYRQGSLSQREFVREHGIGLSTLQLWIRSNRKRSTRPRWLEVPSISQTPVLSDWDAEILLPGSRSIRMRGALAERTIQSLLSPTP